MKRYNFLFAAALMSLLLAGCTAPNPHPMPMETAIQNAKTKADHEALADHYEQAAKDLSDKVTEHKKLLDEYKSRGYLYGKQALNFQSHCQSLIGLYEKAADANREMAKLHHQIADGLK